MVLRPAAAWTAVLAVLMIGCDVPPRSAPEEAEPATPAPAADDRGTVLFIGTSLTAGRGVDPEQAFPAPLQEKIDSAGLPYRVVNAGVSGETSAGALRRIDWLLRQPVEVVVLETGANDMLRRLEPDSTRANIQRIIDRIEEVRPGAEVVLVGMMAPRHLGAAYADRFRELYPRIARDNDLPLVPFLLQGVGGVAELNQSDGIHPNPAGHRLLAENVWPVLERELRERRGGA